ncbi:conserved hypothetical protein [Trichormus variabilis ATCC 29413]|uniref:Uncharacterized protein n=2 Tax=Anabaena variabilis TaxID=264691 RepID=Q3MAF1_TRIV2|nr:MULTISPECIES: hypothetical protein [Nostocaceae]ABA22035.1 conserved hypothetical protein [Trichormus variabilis ATCC 29413]MBC1213703.1 hypothetical protein [Trichormus variabilis ARAD]MBC1258685.1 hypothetical protein [Trichormus variabilis V5]MBC1270433.1 hypothetical protein [Trichormus variabilis FSR]MBC1303252.1 hypothetical protein [Trichormus variabilis N2B]
MKDLELFQFHLDRATYILRFQDKKLIETWVTELERHLAPDYIESCLTAAILELSVSHSETFHWILDHLADWKPYKQLLESVTRFALKKLVQKGFMPGGEFSFTADGKILLTENAKATIMKDTVKTDRLLLEKILLTPQQIHLLTT